MYDPTDFGDLARHVQFRPQSFLDTGVFNSDVIVANEIGDTFEIIVPAVDIFHSCDGIILFQFMCSEISSWLWRKESNRRGKRNFN